MREEPLLHFARDLKLAVEPLALRDLGSDPLGQLAVFQRERGLSRDRLEQVQIGPGKRLFRLLGAKADKSLQRVFACQRQKQLRVERLEHLPLAVYAGRFIDPRIGVVQVDAKRLVVLPELFD